MTWGFGITPAYRLGRVSLFGGVFLRNHPTIVRKGSEYSEINDEDTEAGPPNVLLNAGVAVRFSAFTAMAVVNHNLDRDPVFYGPGIGRCRRRSIWAVSHAATSDDTLGEAKARMRRAQPSRDRAR